MDYHLGVILERELFLCPRSEHNYPFNSDYRSQIEGLDSPLYRLSQNLGGVSPKCGLDNVTARIVVDMTFITTYIQSYMCSSAPDFDHKRWLLKVSRIQNGLSSLPSLSSDKSSSVELFIYECCRLTAIIYCEAIINYAPFSMACTPDDLDMIYSTMDLVPITRWMQIPGIWLWMLCVVNPAARYRFEGLKLRMFMKNCTSALALIDWQILVNCMESFLNVQVWIRERGRRPTAVVKVV
jgi:hypothetical protein